MSFTSFFNRLLGKKTNTVVEKVEEPEHKEPTKEVILTRRLNSMESESILNVVEEVKITGKGDVYVKRKGKWFLDEAAIDVQIIHR